jgi:hypothetical protein
MPINAHLRRVTLILFVGACTSLTGCGVAEEAKKKMDDMVAAQGGSFEDVTRTPVEGAADGRTFLLRAKARKPAHWYQAWAAYEDLPGGYCTDGVPFMLLRESPAHDRGANEPGEYTWHPAGTVFEQVIRCTDPFAGQRIIAADADAIAEFRAVRSALAAGGDYDRNRHLVTSITFNDRQPKYAAASKAIGSMILGTQRRCREAGVTVQRILVHTQPTPEPSADVFMNSAQAIVGIDVACADGLPADDRY